MNKGVANMWRYFQVGIGANIRYLDALAAAPLKSKGVAALDALCQSRTQNGHHYARFNPVGHHDLALFRAVLAGEHTIVGFRNADLAARLYPHPPTTPQEAQRRCARSLPSHRQTPRSRTRRQNPPPTPLPSHPHGQRA